MFLFMILAGEFISFFKSKWNIFFFFCLLGLFVSVGIIVEKKDPVQVYKLSNRTIALEQKSLKEAYYTLIAEEPRKSQVLIDAPLISQLPELPRGCEVTSLAMLLNFAGANVDKMVLAEEVRKDPTPYQKKNGTVYFGNPYDGYVGNMYTLTEPGYGVYHGPIKELAEKYLPNQIVDLTGNHFDQILDYVSQGIPVWVITNTWFSELPETQFRTWETPSGTVKITYREHSVLITGYDENYIYFNDPLANVKNRKIKKENFIAAWRQMGKQAITFIPSS